MYPNQNQNNYSIDYLNQIAPQAPKRRIQPHFLKLFVILGGLFLIAIVIIIIGSLSGKSSNAEQLAARLQSTEQIVGDAQPLIRSSQLRSINSNLKIFLTNTNRDIVEPLKNNGIDTEKLSKSVKEAEAGTELTKTLEDARLNATYDRTYAREMAYRVDTILLLMKDIFGSTKSNSLKSYLETSYANLAPIQKQFAEFNASNG